MIHRNNANATPAIQTLQAKFAMLVAGESVRTLAAKWGVSHMTVWRVMHNKPHCGPKADIARQRLLQFCAHVQIPRYKHEGDAP